MKILVTGGAGFIGSAVVREAIARGHDIVNVDILTYAGNLQNLRAVQGLPNYHFEKCDIADKEAIQRILTEFSPDAVMHLAAESHVDRSISDPSAFIQTNIVGTHNMLQCSNEYWESSGRPGDFRFHHISTDEVFGSLAIDGKDKFTESSQYDPHSPYSASKASADHLVRAWHDTYGLPSLITNCSNNYGPFHYPEKLIPLTIINAFKEKPIPVYGDGRNVRDWLYVEDHADALLRVLVEGAPGRSYNIGGGCELSNLDLVTRICGILDEVKGRRAGVYADLISFVADRPGHDERYAIDYSRVVNEIGWQPKTDIEYGLRATIAWYLNNESWWAPLLKKQGV